MQREIFIGLAAGLVSTALFAAAATGSLLPGPIAFFLVPLPVFIAGLIFGWHTALFAALGSAVFVGIFAGPVGGVAFALLQVAPAVVLTYLAGLYRDVAVSDNNTVVVREWYPPGRLVLWAIALGVVIGVVAVLSISGDIDQFKTMMRERIDTFIDAQVLKGKEGSPISDTDRVYLTDLAVTLMPGAAAFVAAAALLINFWLAGKIAVASGNLERPWPDLTLISYPIGTPIVLAGSLVGAGMLEGAAAYAASATAAGLIFAYVLVGLAIIHNLTRGQGWRPFGLVAVYIAIIALNSLFIIGLVIMALAEPVLPFRRKGFSDTAPPTNGSSPPP